MPENFLDNVILKSDKACNTFLLGGIDVAAVEIAIFQLQKAVNMKLSQQQAIDAREAIRGTKAMFFMHKSEQNHAGKQYPLNLPAWLFEPPISARILPDYKEAQFSQFRKQYEDGRFLQYSDLTDFVEAWERRPTLKDFSKRVREVYGL